MIKNERQYRITKAQAERFDLALREMESAAPEPDIHPIFQKAQVDSLRGQLQELRQELAEYEALRSGERDTVSLQSFDDLGLAVIRARIASGMTQEGLAAKLNLKPQQVQRYEATDYRSASLDRIREVIRVLGMKLQTGVELPAGKSSVGVLFKRLKEVGLDKDFVVHRLLPPLISTRADRGDSVAFEAAEALRHVFGWAPAVLFGSEPLSLATASAATARFKLPARVNTERLSAYVVYAHYLALLVLEATASLEPHSIPLEASEFRRSVLDQFGEITFENVIRFIWRLGVPILPLNDPGGFHGACWRAQARNVIVLKQRTSSPARWLHDVLHEIWHAAHKPDLDQHPVIEESELSPSRRQSQEELSASQFAGDVVLDGRAEELTGECVSQARGQVPLLKNAVPKVAKKAGVPAGALANYIAYRLSLQGITWWATAANLQDRVESVRTTPRELLLQNIDLSSLNEVDRGLLLRALEPIVLGISGGSGAGKTSVAEAVADRLGWPTASFGDYVRTIARSQGLDDSSRDVLEDLGEMLVQADVEQFCLSVLTHFNWKSGGPLVIEGVRHERVAETLRRLVAPMDFRIVYLEVDDQTRKDRLRRRGDREEEVQRIEEHPTEKVVKEQIPQIADVLLEGTGPLDELVKDIVTWVREGVGRRSAA